MHSLPLSLSNMAAGTSLPPWLTEYLAVRANAGITQQQLHTQLADYGIQHPQYFARSCGAFLGLAIGDALGTTLEFEVRDAKHVTDIVGGGPFALKAGYWTDDTSMACCLAHSLIQCQGFNASHLMGCFVNWYRYGFYSPTGTCFDIGGATRTALERFLLTGDPYAGSDNPNAAGNGSLMRLAPVVIYYFGDFEAVVNYAAASSKVTHAAQEAVDACRYFAGLLYGALAGESKQRLLSENYAPVAGYWQREPLAPAVAKIAAGSYKHKTRDQIKSSGYVIDTLEASLWAFYHTDDFRSALISAVNLGDDADTVGAVCGQLCGAFYGETALPIDWINKVYQAQEFYYFAYQMLNVQSHSFE